jgi:hypothetical protein
MPISLKKASGNGGLISPAAAQPFNDSGSLGGVTVTGLDIVTGVNVISLSGKYAISYINLSGLGTTPGDLIVQLTIDGKSVINRTYTAFNPQSFTVISCAGTAGLTTIGSPVVCNQSMTLYVRKALAGGTGTLIMNAVALDN